MRKKASLFFLACLLLLAMTACSQQTDNTPVSSASPLQSAGIQEGEEDGATQQAVQIQGGSDLEHGEAVPLDTLLAGKTAREGEQWFSFTTDQTENATYLITLVNQTPESGDLSLRVFDEAEETVHDPYGAPLQASQGGRASTLSLELPPDTTYYMRIWCDDGDVINYTVIIRSPEGQQPERNQAQPGPQAEDGLEIPAAANQTDARLVPLNAKLSGKVSRGEGQWFAFSTNSAENATYNLTTVNMTRGTGDLNLRVYDAYGAAMNNPYGAPHQAGQDGRASTLSLELPPNTTYYLYIWADQSDTITYTLNIQAPDDAAVHG